MCVCGGGYRYECEITCGLFYGSMYTFVYSVRSGCHNQRLSGTRFYVGETFSVMNCCTLCRQACLLFSRVLLY